MEDRRAYPRLQVLLRDTRLGAFEHRAEDLFKALVRRLDGEVHELHAEVLGCRSRVIEAFGRGVARRHAHTYDVLCAERIASDCGRQRRVDSAGHPDDDLVETLLAHVVVGAEHDRGVDLGRALERLRDARSDWCPGCRRGCAVRADLRHDELESLSALSFMPDLLQRPVDRRCHVDIADEQLLLEGGGSSEKATVRVEDHAVAVEHELVLPADRVDPGHECSIVGRPSADHRLSRRALSVVVRRTVDVDEHLRTVMGFPRHRARGEPAVFAYGQPDPNPVQLDDRAGVAGLEVALLVEDAVVRQEDLVIDGRDLAVVQERGGVEEITVLVDKPDHGGDVRGGPGDHAELREVVADECRLEDEVLGRIAGDRQLRKADDVGARGARLVHPADDQP